jgi:hypothetical protein
VRPRQNPLADGCLTAVEQLGVRYFLRMFSWDDGGARPDRAGRIAVSPRATLSSRTGFKRGTTARRAVGPWSEEWTRDAR